MAQCEADERTISSTVALDPSVGADTREGIRDAVVAECSGGCAPSCTPGAASSSADTSEGISDAVMAESSVATGAASLSVSSVPNPLPARVRRQSRERRVERWRERLPLLDEDPREDELPSRPPGESDANPAALTALGRKLVGLDEWD